MTKLNKKSQQIIKAADVAALAPIITEAVSGPALPEGAAPKKVETKSITLPAGSKETALYVITPAIGGKPRWFEKKRMTSISKDAAGIFTLEMPAKAYDDRKMA